MMETNISVVSGQQMSDGWVISIEMQRQCIDGCGAYITVEVTNLVVSSRKICMPNSQFFAGVLN